MKVNVNGVIVPHEDAKISVFDHGVLYGDGVFEGIRIYNGKIFALDEHIKRLVESAKYIMLTLPCSPEELKKDAIKIARVNEIHDGYIRLVITRGAGTLGLNPFKCLKSSYFIIADTIMLYPPELYENGMSIITVPTQRNMSEAVSPRVKSLNYLNNILAKIEALNAGYEEAIMLNKYGFVAECTGDNIFIVRDNVLVTPPAYMGALEGITRNTVMRLATERDIAVKQRVLSRHDLFCADECFLTGTAAEVIPVTNIDGRIIGDGKPGKITRQVVALFHEYSRSTGTPLYDV
jgi:branched-chain amino acid aminotransferase